MSKTQTSVYAFTLVIGALAALLLLTIACGSVTPQVASNDPQTDIDQAGEGAVTVTVESGDFYLKPSQTTFKVGVPYHFVLTNVGKLPHEVMLMPVVPPSKGMTMTEMDKMAMGMVEEEDFPPSATGTFDVTFTKPYGPGEIELACHIAGHYETGMHAAITVVSQ